MLQNVVVAVAGLLLNGCALGVAADVASTGATGKSVTDHALDAVTDKDCNVIQGATRSDRDVCEEEGSAATKRDFKGLAKSEK